MLYSQDFFRLQLLFARRAAALTGRPLPELLLSHTNFYIRFGAGRDFNPSHPIWQAYLQGLSSQSDDLAWTWGCYRRQAHLASGPQLAGRFGCFAYTLDGDAGIRLHFQHADPAAPTSLGRACQAQRRAELAALCEQAGRTLPGLRRISGQSWLYNLEAYRRLFPPAYITSARPVPARFHSMSLWGQFLNREGATKPDLTAPFLAKLARTQEPQDLQACFPFQILRVSAAFELMSQAWA